MNLKQEAYSEIDRMSDENVRFLIMLMKKIQPEASKSKTAGRNKEKFLASAGKIDIDEDAVNDLRKRSMI